MTLAPRSLTRAGAAAAAVMVALVATATLASAHTTLRVSNPEQGATVDHLSEVRLEFNGDLLEIGTELSIVDSTGAQIELAPEFPSTNAVTATVAQELAPGDAELVFRVVAEDGHPIEGAVVFTYAPAEQEQPAEPSAESEPTATATTPQATASAVEPEAEVTAVPISEEDSQDGSGDVPGWVWPVLALAALAGAGTAIAVAKLRGRS